MDKKKRLLKKIHYDEKLPNATPYVTSYYKKSWGFCLSKNKLKNLNKKKYYICMTLSLKRF